LLSLIYRSEEGAEFPQYILFFVLKQIVVSAWQFNDATRGDRPLQISLPAVEELEQDGVDPVGVSPLLFTLGSLFLPLVRG